MRQLAYYETVDFNKEDTIADLSEVPFFDEARFDTDTFVVRLKSVPGHEILPYPSMGRGVSNNDAALMKYVDSYRKDHGKDPLSKITHVCWGSSFHNCGNHWYEVYLYVNLFDYCDSKGVVLKVKDDESKFPPLKLTGKNLLCRLGWHKWEKEPKIRDYVKHSGIDFLFSSSGVQKGIVRCCRCGERKKVYREGMVGFGGPLSPCVATRWKRLTPEIEKEIDALRRM